MALEINESRTISGSVNVDSTQVVYLNATIDLKGGTNINQIVQNKELYAKHKAECRAEVNEFQNYVYEIEDEMSSAAE